MTATDVQVAGVFETGVIEYDARSLFVPLSVARDLMETGGASSLAAVVHDPADIAVVRDRLARTVSQVTGTGGRVATWEALSPIFGSVVALYRWILSAFVWVVVLAVVLGIANTMSMAVLERVAEVGVLRAIGFGRLRVLLMFLCEAMCIGALGALAGTVVGGMACRLLTRLAIAMPPPPGNSQGYVLEIPIVGTAFVWASSVAVLAALVAGFLPALRAVRGEVVDALRA
jgi:putative ABC transport system permease protein